VKFVIPLQYTFLTRIVGIKSIVYVILFQILPCFLYIASITEAFSLFIVLICAFYLYEWGYLYNDAITSDRELHPTIRIDKNTKAYIKKNIWLLLTPRLVGILFLQFFFDYGYALSLIIVVFFVYNNIRNILNAFIQPILTYTKLVIPIAVVADIPDLIFYGFYIIPNFIERILSKKYIGKYLNFDTVYFASQCYYTLFCVLVILLMPKLNFVVISLIMLLASFNRKSY
jgi:hypothetical protein